jgi:outer membrane protein assembly factor BamE (lipoprotein component of BamABCDE complex)
MRPKAGGPNKARFRLAPWRTGALMGLMLTAAVACTPLYRDHGYAPTDAELAALTIGKDTRETVTQAVGRPGTLGVLDDNRWYYVQSRYQKRGVAAPKEIERQVVVITFAESGTVANIERFGLERGQVVALSRRVTETNIENISFLGQLLGNFGRVNANQVLPGDG